MTSEATILGQQDKPRVKSDRNVDMDAAPAGILPFGRIWPHYIHIHWDTRSWNRSRKEWG